MWDGSERPRLTRVTLDERGHSMQAALTMIQAYRAHHDGHMLVVDAGVRDRATTWSNGLASIGLRWHPGSAAMNQQPTHHAVVRAARLAQGMSAWSLESLRGVFFSSVVPFNDDLFPELNHPSEGTWRPQPDAAVLDDISRQFHVLGGPGAIARWLGVLAGAEPSFAERRPEEKARGRSNRRSGGSLVCFALGRRFFPPRTVICCDARWWGAPAVSNCRCPTLLLPAWPGSRGCSPPSTWPGLNSGEHPLMQALGPSRRWWKP